MSVLQEAAERFADTSWQIHRQWSSKKQTPVKVNENNNTINTNTNNHEQQQQQTIKRSGNKIVTIETVQTTLTPNRTNGEPDYGTINSRKTKTNEINTNQTSKRNSLNEVEVHYQIISDNRVPKDDDLKKQTVHYKIETLEYKSNKNNETNGINTIENDETTHRNRIDQITVNNQAITSNDQVKIVNDKEIVESNKAIIDAKEKPFVENDETIVANNQVIVEHVINEESTAKKRRSFSPNYSSEYQYIDSQIFQDRSETDNRSPSNVKQFENRSTQIDQRPRIVSVTRKNQQVTTSSNQKTNTYPRQISKNENYVKDGNTSTKIIVERKVSSREVYDPNDTKLVDNQTLTIVDKRKQLPVRKKNTNYVCFMFCFLFYRKRNVNVAFKIFDKIIKGCALVKF